MPLTPQEGESIQKVSGRLREALELGLANQPQRHRQAALRRIEEALRAQDALDPTSHPRDWFHPLRDVVDWLEDQRLVG